VTPAGWDGTCTGCTGFTIAIGKAAQAGGGPKQTRGVIVTFAFTKATGVGQDAVGLAFEGQVGTIRGVVMPARA